MQISLDRSKALHTIGAYGPEGIKVNEQWHTQSLIIPFDGPLQNWAINSFAELTFEHLRPFLSGNAHVILIGTGQHNQLPMPKWTESFYLKGIGIEFMASKQACQTYSVMSQDQRKVIAGIIFEGNA